MLHKLINRMEQCQLKFSNDNVGEFEGYASVYDSVDQVGDTIAKGAFDESLASGRTVKMFVNHAQHEVPVGDWLKMSSDDRGLKAVGMIDMNHKDGPTVYSALKRGAMDGLSIGFTMKDGDYEQKSEGRLIKNLNLMETSIVSFPCEGQARISAVKADMADLSSLKDCEDYLREVCGFSKSMAKTFVSQFIKISRSAAEDDMRQITEKANADALAILGNIKAKL